MCNQFALVAHSFSNPKNAKKMRDFSKFYKLKDLYPDRVLLFRDNSFYEMYKSDAKKCSKILGISLTKTYPEGVDMAAFPHHAIDTFLPKLIRAGLLIAICDTIEQPKTLAKRGVI